MSQIRGIMMPPSSLGVKKTAGWHKALLEMKEYIRKCEYVSEENLTVNIYSS